MVHVRRAERRCVRPEGFGEAEIGTIGPPPAILYATRYSSFAMLTPTSEVVKHSAAIQITNRVTLLQRRAWNVLLANAYDELGPDAKGSSRQHSIAVSELTEALGISTHNTGHIKSLLEGLTETSVKWNVLKKDGKTRWGAASLLSLFEVEDGVCTYDFGGLGPKLHNPSVYARIKLSTANRFGSRHALALYELGVDYLRIFQTPWIGVTEFRELMGLGEDEYPEWYDLKRYVIVKALDEVCKVSDITMRYDTRKEGRSVSEIKFLVSPKAQTRAAAVARQPVTAPLPALAAAIERERDPYGDWFDALPPLERSALEAEAEQVARASDPNLKGVLLTVRTIEVLRGVWRERMAREDPGQ